MEQDNKKPRIMIAGDSLSQETGLSYVASSWMRLLEETDKYVISHMTLTGEDTTYEGMAVHGKEFQDIFRDINKYNCQVTDKNCYNNVDKAIEQERPNIVFTVHDPWVIDSLAYSSYRESYSLVNYVTVEIPTYPYVVMQPSPISPGQRKSIKDILSRADMIIPVTEMGAEALRAMNLEVTENIYNGLDWDKRCQRPGRKSEVFGGAVRDTDFVFMTMGMNTERKRLDRVIEAFYKLQVKMKFTDKIKLYLHSDLDTNTGGTDLREMMDQLGLSDYVLISTNLRSGKGIAKDELYRRYAACDCYIGLPSGEGFGYGFAEAMMHKLPLIYINYGGHTDYCKSAGQPVGVSEYVTAKNAYMKWALADTDEAAKVMARLYSDKKLRRKLSKNGYEIAESKLKWDTLFKQLEPKIEELLNKAKASNFAGIPLRRIV